MIAIRIQRVGSSMRLPAAAAVVMLLASLPAEVQAQTSSDLSKKALWFGHIEGGLSFPAGRTSDAAKTGGGFGAGFGYWIGEVLGVEVDYTYTGYSLERDALGSGDLFGLHAVHAGNLNVIFDLMPTSPFGLYIIAGPGLYYRRVSVDEFEGAASGVYCDPWLFFCYPSAVPVTSVVDTRDSWDFGIDAGLGLQAKVYAQLAIFVEVRYHYVWGPTIETESGSRRADGQYVPILLGVRF